MVVTNSGIDPVNNIVLTDPIDPATTFVTGSVLVNGTPRASANPALGIALGTLAPGESIAVSYAVRVNSLPSPPQVSSQSSVSFTSGVFSGAAYSNTIVTPIYQPIITVAKTASTSNATIGDDIVYSFTINNSGNLVADLTLTDNIPAGAVLLPNSVLIDGIPRSGANPEAGIVVGDSSWWFCECNRHSGRYCRFTASKPAAEQPGCRELYIQSARRTRIDGNGIVQRTDHSCICSKCGCCQKHQCHRCCRGRCNHIYRSGDQQRYRNGKQCGHG